VIVSQSAYRRELARLGPQPPSWMNTSERQEARAARSARQPLPDPVVELVDWSARQAPVTERKNDPRLAVLLEDDGGPDRPLRNRGDLQEARAAKARAAKRQSVRPSASTNPLLVHD
jgi:hypothetical protein